MKMFQEGSGRERQRIEAEEVVVHKTKKKMIRVFCVCKSRRCTFYRWYKLDNAYT